MDKKYLTIGIIALVILAVAITLFVVYPGNPKKCGDGICGVNENWGNCLKDCPKPVKPVCGDDICQSGEDSNNCLKDCPITGKCGDRICDAKEFAKPSLCPKDCTNNCGNKICESGESCGNCESDCGSCPIMSRCGDGVCNSNESCTSCPQDCGGCPAASGESHFGVHSETSIYPQVESYIRELGGVYVRVGFRDTIGWRIVKPGGGNIPICKSCCVSPSPSCNCAIGDRFYCNMPRDGLLSEGLAIDLYKNDFKLLASAGANRYDTTTPKFLTATYPHGREDVYKEFIRILVGPPSGISDKVKYWEIENEVQAPMFWSGSAQEYADMVLLANEEIKSYCPDCKVGISLGTPSPNGKWLNAMFGICDSIDFLDLHYPLVEDTALDNWKNNCPNTEVITTESGLPDYDIKLKEGGLDERMGGTPEKQAQDLVKYNSILFNAGYDQVYWFIIDFDWNPKMEDDFWEHAGLLTDKYARKPSFDSYKTMIAKVDYFTSITKLAEGQYKYAFPNKNPVYVLWCDSGTCPVPSEIQGTVKVTDYLGNEQTKQASQIVLSGSPIFIE